MAPVLGGLWQQVMGLAAAEFRAVAIDLPGVGQSAGTATDGSKQALAAVVHGLIEQLGLDRPVICRPRRRRDDRLLLYLRRYQDAAAVAIVDVVIPGLDPWDEVIANPYLWHFAFHTIPALPELLVQGRQGPDFDYFFDVLAADPARITTPGPGRLRAGVRLRRGPRRRVRLLPHVRAGCR